MKTIRFAALVLAALVAAAAAASWAAGLGSLHASLVATAVPPPIRFEQCDAQLVTGANQTSGVANATAVSGATVDLIPYCCFEAGFDGWRYWDSEGDGAGAGVLRGYYDSSTGAATPGSVALAAENAPSGFSGYSYIFIPFNYTFSDTNLPATISLSYMYRTYIISTVTGYLYVAIANATGSIIWYQLVDYRNTQSNWNTVNIDATGILPEPGQYYFIVYVSWSTGSWGLTNSLYIYVDDIHYNVTTNEVTWQGCVLHVAITNSSGNAWIELANYSLAPDTSYVDIYMVNGVYSSTHITYDGSTWNTNSTQPIPVNSSDNLLNFTDIKLSYRATGASNDTSVLDFNVCFNLGGVQLCGVLRVYINR